MAKRGPKGPSKPMSDEEYEKLIAMIRIQCTQEEICGIYEMSIDTLNRRISERGDENFAGLYKKHSDEGKASLRRSQWKKAQEGNATMLIWLGKQMLGQRDSQDLNLGGQDGNPVIHRIELVSGEDDDGELDDSEG
jgi:hypothetical protein